MTNEKTQKPEEKKTEKKTAGALTAVIRISGMVKVREVIENPLSRIRLRRKYSCVLVDLNNKSMAGILKKVKHYVAYGEIDKTTLVKLIKARGKSIDGDKKEIKIDSEKVAEDLMNGKKLTELGLKGFFRLAPPKKGINSKLQYPKGVLGNNKKDINKLIERML
jgi:large subunit ribosomal protein L30